MTAPGYADRYVSAPDGLRLHARDYGAHPREALPLVCLPGLARTAADFDVLANALSQAETPRRVVAIDYRGRGLSAYDDDPDHYHLAVELSDLLAVLTAFGIARAIFLGTSRGGLLTMLLASHRPDTVAGAILNDIGPVIEPQGLARIKTYLGKLPEPRSMTDAAHVLKRLFGGQFPKLNAEDWLRFAERTFQERAGRIVPTYDPQLAKTLEKIDLNQPIPPLWTEFDALASVPLMVIRGALSDILLPATVALMRKRRPLDLLEVPDQGHAPLLMEPDVIARIATFAAQCDRGTRS